MFGTDFADVDNDGDLDVASMSFGCCTGVHVYLNQGDGSWTPTFGFLGGNSATLAVFGDVNSDGWRGSRRGTRSRHRLSRQRRRRLRARGRHDLPGGGSWAPGHSTSATSTPTERRSMPSRWAATCASAGGPAPVGPNLSNGLPRSSPLDLVQLADMDFDGHLDLVGFGGGLVGIFLGDGAGNWSFGERSFSVGTTGSAVVLRAGDADHNGRPDIALVAEASGWNGRNHVRFYKEASIPTSLSVRPVAPDGGETFYVGSTHFVDWLSAVPDGEAASVRIELSVSGPGRPVAAGSGQRAEQRSLPVAHPGRFPGFR